MPNFHGHFLLFLSRDLLGIFYLGKALSEDRLGPGVSVDRFCALGASFYAGAASDATLGIYPESIQRDRLGRADLRAGAAESAVRADSLRESESKPLCQIIRKLSYNIKSAWCDRELFSVLVGGNRKNEFPNVAESIGKNLLFLNAIGKGMRKRTGHNSAEGNLGGIKELSCLLGGTSDSAGAVAEHKRSLFDKEL